MILLVDSESLGQIWAFAARVCPDTLSWYALFASEYCLMPMVFFFFLQKISAPGEARTHSLRIS